MCIVLIQPPTISYWKRNRKDSQISISQRISTMYFHKRFQFFLIELFFILIICTTYENYHCNIIKGNSSLRFLQPLKTRTSTKYLIQLTFFGIDTTKINSQKMLVRWNFSLRIYPFLSKQHFYKQRQAEIGKKSGKS